MGLRGFPKHVSIILIIFSIYLRRANSAPKEDSCKEACRLCGIGKNESSDTIKNLCKISLSGCMCNPPPPTLIDIVLWYVGFVLSTFLGIVGIVWCLLVCIWSCSGEGEMFEGRRAMVQPPAPLGHGRHIQIENMESSDIIVPPEPLPSSGHHSHSHPDINANSSSPNISLDDLNPSPPPSYYDVLNEVQGELSILEIVSNSRSTESTKPCI